MCQHNNTVKAVLNPSTNIIDIQQEFIYHNTSNQSLEVIYMYDWANAYYSKNSDLSKGFIQDFKKNLHLAKTQDRGRTDIIGISDGSYKNIDWERAPKSDLLKLNLNLPINPGAKAKLILTYKIQLPPDRYTGYGYGNTGYYLKDWYLSPPVFDNGKWSLYSNKNLEDLFTPITNTQITLTFPKEYFLISNYGKGEISKTETTTQTQIITGIERQSCEISLSEVDRFKKHKIKDLTILTDITSPRIPPVLQGISINKVAEFINENLGAFPHNTIVISEKDYRKDPIYGLNQLPSFIRPYEDNFQFEIKLLKTALSSYLKESFHIDLRKEKWVHNAILNYMMISFVSEKYPNQKLIGKLARIWAIKSLYLAKTDFNGQYPLLYMLTARKNIQQSLATSNDSLIKFNQKIANPYKAGLGLSYLSSYIGKENIDNAITELLKTHKNKLVKASNFEEILKKGTTKEIDWFFSEYVSKNKRLDFKIKTITTVNDSLEIVLKNKTAANIPVAIFGLKNDSLISKYWFKNNEGQYNTFRIPNSGEEKLVLNYDKKLPEFNLRDNWKSVKPSLFQGKKLRFQLFKDIEDPNKYQIFYVPTLTFNVYDGLAPGLRFHNKSFLRRAFVYDFTPTYATKERALIGNAKLSYTKDYNKNGLYFTSVALRASSFHFQTNSRYKKIVPSFSMGWRPEDRLSNKRHYFNLRYVSVQRDLDENIIVDTEPDYGVLNARFGMVNNNLIDYFSWSADVQHATDFNKVALTLEYRKLFENNKQFNLRFFAGKFLRNNSGSDYFSFALDRPTDYLFDYAYLGRSEDSGIISQQIIIAEGGFKSQLENPFSNDWMATVNTSLNIWKWVEFYSDFGFVKNKGIKQKMVYDSGIRLNLVTDYFELYFPLYSNNGWEVSQPHYDQKIRFIITLSPKTLLGLFNRKWF